MRVGVQKNQLQIYKNKRMDEMIQINKTEKEIINKKIPSAHIVRTMKKHSKRHRYYCEETPWVIKLLSELRNGNKV